MKSPRANVALRLAMAALTFMATMQWHPASVLAGEYIGNDPVVAAHAERAQCFERWQHNGDTVAYLEYVEARSETAAQVAISVGMLPEKVQNSWAEGDLGGQRAALAALTQVGVPYKRYTEEEGVSFDCSGLTGYAWDRAGVDLPRSSRYQYRSADRVDPENARVGDLAWYPGHIMLYLGVDSLIVHSPREVEPSSTARCLRIVQVGCASLTHSHQRYLRGESDLSRCAGERQFDRCDSQ